MDGLILEFAACCRANGMRISTAEVLDCLNHLDLARVRGESVFHTVLRANFAKSRREQGEFDRLYRLFFHEMKKGIFPDAGAGTDETGAKGETAAAPDLGPLMDALNRSEAGLDPAPCTDADKAMADFMTGDPKAFIAAVYRIHDQDAPAGPAVKSNLGQLTGRLEILLAVNGMKARLARFLGGPDAHLDETAALAALAEKRLDTALAYLSQDPRPDNNGLIRGGPVEAVFSGLGEVPFANLTQDEMDRVAEVIDPWVKKLDDMASLRFAAARKGPVDVKKTIQRSARYLGVPVEIVRRDRPPRRGKILTLCDVSGSVWSSARFMLSILHSFQTCFARVKSFVFIDRPIEVTGLFLAHGANGAIKKILGDPDLNINYHAKTDYGLVFQGIRDQYLKDLDKKTTLVIMGDGRSNYLNPREPVLEALRDRCRRLVWLNPEQERFWGTGDSEMLRYRHHCNEARPCGNLNQLMGFIRDLVL